MVPGRVRRLNEAGWTLAELLVVVVIIGILAAVATPFIVNYLRSSTVRAGAQEVRTALYQAKQLAITRRQNICVQVVAVPFNGYQFRQNNCVGAALVMPGTEGTGTFRLQNNIALAGAAIAFTPLGGAAPAGQFTVTGPNGGALTVTVSVAGRITTP